MNIRPGLFFLITLLGSPLPVIESQALTAGTDARLLLVFQRAYAPEDAPEAFKQAVAAANEIAGRPYKVGGGHEDFTDTGYDCSGSVSCVLGRAGLLASPLDSREFQAFGEEGPGQWITIYSRAGHVFLVLGGIRFDTTDRDNVGPGWRLEARPPAGFAARHPKGL